MSDKKKEVIINIRSLVDKIIIINTSDVIDKKTSEELENKITEALLKVVNNANKLQK